MSPVPVCLVVRHSSPGRSLESTTSFFCLSYSRWSGICSLSSFFGRFNLSLEGIQSSFHFVLHAEVGILPSVLQGLPVQTLEHASVSFYLHRFSESRSSSGSTPSVRLSATLLGCLVCVIYNSNSFYSSIFKLCLMIVHTLKVCTFYFVHI